MEGIFQSTPDGRLLTANPALARMLGYESVAELLARAQDVAHQLKVHHYFIVLALAGADGHGLGIAREVERLSEGRVRLWPATLYGSLEELLERGLIEELDDPRRRPPDESERKRFYRVTRAGRAAAGAETERLAELVKLAARPGDRVSCVRSRSRSRSGWSTSTRRRRAGTSKRSASTTRTSISGAAGSACSKRVRLWVPAAGDPNQEGRSCGWLGVGRMKPGVGVAEAEQDLLRAHAPIWEARDKDNGNARQSW